MSTLALSDTQAPAANTSEGPPPAPEASTTPDNWAGSHLHDTSQDPLANLQRALIGLSLAGAMGLASGLVREAHRLPENTFAVMWVPLSVLLFAVPGLYILLALFDAPVSPRQMLRWCARATFSVGLTYAGLAPLVGLYALTASVGATLWVASLAMAFGGLHGLGRLLASLDRALAPMGAMARLRCRLAMAGFGLFALLLALRALSALPVLGGGA